MGQATKGMDAALKSMDLVKVWRLCLRPTLFDVVLHRTCLVHRSRLLPISTRPPARS